MEGSAGSDEPAPETAGLLGGLLDELPPELPPEMLSAGAEVPAELPDDEPPEDGEPRLPEGGSEAAGGSAAGGSAADWPTAASRVGPQLAASRKKAMRAAAAALRMFQTCLLPRFLPCLLRLPTKPSELAPMRFEKRTRVGFLFKTAGAFSPLLPGIQTNQGRFCAGGGSRLPTSWG